MPHSSLVLASTVVFFSKIFQKFLKNLTLGQALAEQQKLRDEEELRRRAEAKRQAKKEEAEARARVKARF